ncbi:MAG: RNA polymerase sigma factor [bacterium]
MDKPSQNALLTACQKGDQDAFKKLFEQYHKRVLHLAFRLCSNIQDAQDITQDVFLKVYKEISNFQAGSNFFTWLYRITVNLYLDKSRKRKRREKYQAKAYFDSSKDVLSKTVLEQRSNALNQQILQEELQHLLQLALNQIKPKLRTVIVLRDIEGLSYGEVAQIVGCSEGTISSRLNRGRKKLKHILSQMGIDETYFEES